VFLEEYTGRGVRVAIVDSGVYASHPHVRGVEQGVAIRGDGSLDDDYVDRLGHGTAVAAVIREKSPDAAIVVIKIFWQSLSTGIRSLVGGIAEANARDAAVVNLSLGTTNQAHRPLIADVVFQAKARGTAIVAAVENEIEWLPGSLDGVIPVALDWNCPRHEYRLVTLNGRPAIAASGYPREIPNVSPERNLKGISFAVANASGFVARARQSIPDGPPEELWKALEAGLRSDHAS
jgi:subtilisin family serine protease